MKAQQNIKASFYLPVVLMYFHSELNDICLLFGIENLNLKLYEIGSLVAGCFAFSYTLNLKFGTLIYEQG